MIHGLNAVVVLVPARLSKKPLCAITLTKSPRNGGDMTADTTFKEFVEEEGLTLSLLEVGSLQYGTSSRDSTRSK